MKTKRDGTPDRRTRREKLRRVFGDEAIAEIDQAHPGLLDSPPPRRRRREQLKLFESA